jgi:hypothetical protein
MQKAMTQPIETTALDFWRNFAFSQNRAHARMWGHLSGIRL